MNQLRMSTQSDSKEVQTMMNQSSIVQSDMDDDIHDSLLQASTYVEGHGYVGHLNRMQQDRVKNFT